MLKALLYLKLLIIVITQNQARSAKKGSLTDNYLNDDASWPGLWFPHSPSYKDNEKHETVDVANSEENSNNKNHSSWSGLWFPHPPNYHISKNFKADTVKFNESADKNECDDGKYGLSIDFDPKDKRHSYNYLCLDKRSKYAPNLNTSALIQECVIPPVYEPPVKCLNESIEYEDLLPTFGAYRPLAPKFGSYQYLPPQRWLHSLADGAIVLLYHPCAFPGQVEKLQNVLKSCLYRHIITPSQLLTPQRPLALLAWGKSLQMSVVDNDIVVRFIKENAKLGFRQKQQKLKLSLKFYDADLLTEAHLITDEQDIEICSYNDLR